MLFTLRPLVLETEGLIAALTTMAEKINEVYQQKVIVDADPQVVEQMEASHQTVVFALAEEAVNNARKHAEANEIWVRIKHPGNEQSVAVLEIADNGVGFDVQSVLGSYERRGSMGMVNLRERAELISGLLKIDSLPGKGTRVRVYIPLNEEAADRLNQGK
jgi:signal transduction histidine kinase